MESIETKQPAKQTDQLVREQLAELLKGGFAPNVILLREFDYKKADILLDGLHFSAWILLGHIRARHQTLLRFMQHPHEDIDVWPDAHWPENHKPQSEEEWNKAIDAYAQELQEMIALIKDPATALFEVRPNGKTVSWAAMTALHHTGYHIGQLKTIGRQLGVW
ncbi:hypothetical protein [Pontibacter mangrovi]|uniref:DinB family protein n=1 Tax=Pontibacter mangrovi TaxID=2589816 RepID=A0A501WGX3_9BACT|nr:hypothetical protein [Pontibacter mangrovi]TPE46267.1 hypothetical protein FJM65_02685 [Pontibacter mangrovi]